MSEEELININGIREDLYQAMQIADITLKPKISQELYDFMNYQDKEIKRLSNIINELDKWLEVNLTNLEKEETSNIYNEGLKQGMLTNGRLIKGKLQELKGSENNDTI